jgi:hypothetical protein
MSFLPRKKLFSNYNLDSGWFLLDLGCLLLMIINGIKIAGVTALQALLIPAVIVCA